MSISRIKQAELLLRECVEYPVGDELTARIQKFLNPDKKEVQPHQRLLDLFASEFYKHFKVGYVPNFAQDLRSAKALLAATMLPPEEIVSVAVRAWNNGQYWGPKVTTIVMLHSRWSAVVGENRQCEKNRPDNLNDKFLAAMGGLG